MKNNLRCRQRLQMNSIGRAHRCMNTRGHKDKHYYEIDIEPITIGDMTILMAKAYIPPILPSPWKKPR